MALNVTKIKTRIKSVSGALKVTSAMKLVSTVKLNRYKGKMISLRSYVNEVDEITAKVLSSIKKYKSPFLSENDNNKNLFIIISSTLGLCGAYNQNIFKLAEVKITNNDDAIILGKKGIGHFKDGIFTKISDFENYSSINDSGIITSITNFVINEYLKGTYKQIHLIYSHYKNSLVFMAKDYQVLPLHFESKEENGFEPILEPDEKGLVDTLVPLYIKNTIYAKMLESEVCEQASRSNAMENATNNANEILNTLQIEFNKARQNAITQEIIEIVGASKSV